MRIVALKQIIVTWVLCCFSYTAWSNGFLGAEYDTIFPYYVKYCASSRIRTLDGHKGVMFGHAVFYLKGVCTDKNIGPSGLKLCAEDADYANPELGVGITVNTHLKNVNFLTFPSRELFFGGALALGEVLSSKTKERLIRQVQEQNIFEGIEVYENKYPKNSTSEDRRRDLAVSAFGNDYALSLARNLHCINVPLSRALMGEVVRHLNGINDSYANSQGSDYRGIFRYSRKKDACYHFSGISDNCAHTPVNALASLGIIPSKRTNQPFFRQIKNIAIPSNTLLNIHKNINIRNIDVDAIYNNRQQRELFLKYRWIPQAPGALTEFIPAYDRNEIYQNDTRLFALFKIWKHAWPKLDKTAPGESALMSNRRDFLGKYEKALQTIEEREASAFFKEQEAKSAPDWARDLNKRKDYLQKTIMAAVRWKKHEMNEFERQIAELDKQLQQHQNAVDYLKFVKDFKMFVGERLASLQEQTIQGRGEL